VPAISIITHKLFNAPTFKTYKGIKLRFIKEPFK